MKHHKQPDLEDSYAPRVPPPIRAFSWKGALSPLLIIPALFPPLVALFAPDNVLELLPQAAHFTEWVQSMLPTINMRGRADSTIFPQVALLVSSLAVVALAWMSVVWLWQTTVNYPYLLTRRQALGRLTIKQHLISLVSVPVFILAFYVFVAMPGDPSYAKGFTTHNRYGFALAAFLGPYPLSMLIGVQVANIRLFVDTYLRNRGGN